MKIRNMLFILLFFWMNLSLAGQFPVPSSIYINGSPVRTLYVRWDIVDLPEADALAPTGYWFGSAKSIINDFPVVQSETCSGTLCGTKVIPGETISSAAMRAYKKGPTTTQYSSTSGANGFCIAFGGIPQGNTSLGSALIPTGCLKAPPPNVYCFIITPEINLNHGSISIKDVTTSKASASFSINCSQANNVKLSLASKLTYIPLNNDAKANIMINNKNPGQQHSLPTGLSSLTITSQLEGITQSGNYSGTAVLIIEPV
ncbi:hypothetical protein [Pantoea sp. CTOTU49201]|uniref:MrpH family fimbial adhesin n=1 Tax=Pantoea sp. CTOTU49201 TaxID=2953855 RepID=UPI0028A2AFE2|nr:hypothetical protein [Pantoea sp. CTOTU49201]